MISIYFNLKLTVLVIFLVPICTNANIEPFTKFSQLGRINTNNILSSDHLENSASFLRTHLQSLLSTENINLPGVLLGNGPQDTVDLEDVSPECRDHVDQWLSQLGSTEPQIWAIQMIDAWGKFPEGILSGHFAVPGDFDECLGIRAIFNNSGELSDSKARYCYTSLSVPILAGLPIEFGTCYPYSCSKEDVTILQNNALGALNINATQSGCYTDDPPNLTAGDISMIVVLAVLGALCILGTFVDLVLNREDPSVTDSKGVAIQYLVAFSLYTNTMKWLGTKSGGDNFGCIHGLRFLSTSWVVLCHTWGAIMSQPLWNMFEFMNLQKDRWTIISIVNGTVSVDTFFTMSGLLFSYNLLKMLDKTKGKLNVPMFYLHRYLRLTPTYALLVGIMATWFVYLGNGPKWAAVESSAILCQKYWWHNLLYINNLWDYGSGPDAAGAMCHGETWYLANDMQFFLVSPLLIYPLWRWKKIGITIMTLATAASVAVPFTVHYNSELNPTLLPLNIHMPEFMTKSYFKPWMRIGPYMAGLWTGYILHSFANKGKKLKLPKTVVLAGWCISTATALAIIFGIIPYFDITADIPNLDAAFYAGFHRFAWGVVISWIIVACTQGYGGFVNTFLSWKVFIPLGRLSFCVYLISFQLQLLFHSRVRQAVSYDVYTATNLFFAHMVTSLLVGFICCITMESPFIVLEKLIFQGVPKKSSPEKTVSDVEEKQRNGEE